MLSRSRGRCTPSPRSWCRQRPSRPRSVPDSSPMSSMLFSCWRQLVNRDYYFVIASSSLHLKSTEQESVLSLVLGSVKQLEPSTSELPSFPRWTLNNQEPTTIPPPKTKTTTTPPLTFINTFSGTNDQRHAWTAQGVSHQVFRKIFLDISHQS